MHICISIFAGIFKQFWRETVDRLPVLLTGNGQSQLLAVPKLPLGTREAQAKAIFSILKDWNLKEKVQGMYFDTTSSNTGRHKGA